MYENNFACRMFECKNILLAQVCVWTIRKKCPKTYYVAIHPSERRYIKQDARTIVLVGIPPSQRILEILGNLDTSKISRTQGSLSWEVWVSGQSMWLLHPADPQTAVLNLQESELLPILVMSNLQEGKDGIGSILVRQKQRKDMKDQVHPYASWGLGFLPSDADRLNTDDCAIIYSW